MLIGIAFIIKLFSLQVLNSTYKKTATKNVLREIVDYPSRGLIYDRNGELLVYNQPSYDLMATPREVGIFDTLQLCSVLDIKKEDLVLELEKAKKYSRYKPSVVVKQISSERYAFMQEKMYKFPGFYFQIRTLRKYTYNTAAHVLGYISEVNQTQINNDDYYKSGDYFGKTGIENAYEKILRGEKGASFFLVDVHNRIKGSYENGRMDKRPVKGKDIVTTLDITLQKYGEVLMQNKTGSIVAIEPATGEIIALISTPSYNPDEMVGRARMLNFPRLVADTLLPLYNRAIKAQYPPGSTFKMLNGLIGLHENVITPYTRFLCAHGYHVGSFTQACHHDQEFSLTPSIAQSCNAYYANTFRRTLENPQYGSVKTGYEKWREHVVSFGFSQKVSIEFDEELKGFIPTSDYYQKKVFPYSRWRALPLISLAIGQGEIQTTPLQMANYTAILANRGYYYTPHVIKRIAKQQIDKAFSVKHKTTIDSIYFDEILDGMEQVFNAEYGGTAYMSSIPGIRACGKTGTAENPHGPEHSTFISFAPRDYPQIAIAVYVENGKWGNLYAAPIASLMMEMYLNKKIHPSRKWLEEHMMNVNLLYPEKPNFIKYSK